jgi:hypothetical protein
MQINIVQDVHSHNADKAITGLGATTPCENADERHIAASRIPLLIVERGMAFSAVTCCVSVVLGIWRRSVIIRKRITCRLL